VPELLEILGVMMAGSYKQVGRYGRSPKTVERFKRVNRIKVMGSREDDDYWNNKDWTVGEDAEASCDTHGEDEMYYNRPDGEWYCLACQKEDDIVRTYNYG
jgi:hypothetical protein